MAHQRPWQRGRLRDAPPPASRAKARTVNLPFPDDEIEAQLLRGGDRIGHRGDDWVVLMVSVTPEKPVLVSARRLRNDKPSGEPKSLTFAIGEIVRIRK